MYDTSKSLKKLSNLSLLLGFLLLSNFSINANTLIVTNTSDIDDGVCNSDCSLREAVNVANKTSADEIIVFAPTIFDSEKTITLSGKQLVINNNGTLTINGNMSSLISISAGLQSRIFLIDQSANVSITNLRITEGRTEDNSGGIKNFGNLTLTNTILDNNRSSFYGGAISNVGKNGSLTIKDSVLHSNDAGDGSGGAIANFGDLLIKNTKITDNHAAGDGGGIIIQGGYIEIVDSSIANNEAYGGGGISIGFGNNSDVYIHGSTIKNNNTVARGAGIQVNNGVITLLNSTLSGNTAHQYGGGIYVQTGVVVLTNTTIAFNQALTAIGIRRRSICSLRWRNC